MRSCCVGLKHYKIHVLSAFIILIGVIISNLDLTIKEEQPVTNYALLFMLSAFFDVISHSIKEGLVRSQPLN
jgi:hypothetical protein